MIRATYEQLFKCLNIGAVYRERIVKENKLSYAIKRFTKANQKHVDKYNELVKTHKVNHASVDERKNLLFNGAEYSYTPEMQIVLNGKIAELNNTEIEVETFLTKREDVPQQELSVAWLDVFEGMVIEMDVNAE